MIIQAKDIETAAEAVISVGGRVTHTLGIIRSVGADLTPSQLESLKSIEGLTIRENRKVKADDSPRGSAGRR